MKEINGITKIASTVYLKSGKFITEDEARAASLPIENAYKNTIAYSILNSHNTSGNDEDLKIKFDALASHDITYVGIIQTARASGLEKFPVPYVLTNCHNSLCAVGGTINEDDHVFGLSAAKKYGGIFVPPHIAVIHQYMREMFAGCGKMILGSDSHTRYGALGTISVGEGGPEIVKQLLSKTYDIKRPEVVAVYLTGTPSSAVGPQDVALSLIGATFGDGFVKNRILEFMGPALSTLSVDYRIGIDVMTTETTCLSSIWETDEKVKEYLTVHGRSNDYKELSAPDFAKYDRAVIIDLSKLEPVIALPCHPSNVVTIRELKENAYEILKNTEKEILDKNEINLSLTSKIKDGRIIVDQGVIAGCAGGGFENLVNAAAVLDGASTGCGEFALSVYPASQPVYIELLRQGVIEKLALSGATIRTAFCGPCFGAGDVPSNGGLSIRHSTRNFPNREGSKPGNGQTASVALMDARSIAATARNGGALTGADEIEYKAQTPVYHFDKTIYDKRVYSGCADASAELKFGPNIADWPEQIPLCDDIALVVASRILDDVTTTDELIPSGETSSYRSNPLKLAEFALSRKDPEYVARAKKIFTLEKARRENEKIENSNLEFLEKKIGKSINKIEIGSVVCAKKPGDGSAREQAASCQRVLGGLANISCEYATKRYRSNLINWGMIPFTFEDISIFDIGDVIYVTNVKEHIANCDPDIPAKLVSNGQSRDITLHIAPLTDDERKILLCGCLINYYSQNK